MDLIFYLIWRLTSTISAYNFRQLLPKYIQHYLTCELVWTHVNWQQTGPEKPEVNELWMEIDRVYMDANSWVTLMTKVLWRQSTNLLSKQLLTFIRALICLFSVDACRSKGLILIHFHLVLFKRSRGPSETLGCATHEPSASVCPWWLRAETSNYNITTTGACAAVRGKWKSLRDDTNFISAFSFQIVTVWLVMI